MGVLNKCYLLFLELETPLSFKPFLMILTTSILF